MRSYTILTSGAPLAGTFAGVASNLVFLMPTLSYVGNTVVLNIQAGMTTVAGTIDYRTAAATQNQRAIADGLTASGMQNGGSGAILTAFNQLTVAQAQAAFDSISGEGITGAQNVAYRSSALFTSSIVDQTVFYGSGVLFANFDGELSGVEQFMPARAACVTRGEACCGDDARPAFHRRSAPHALR